ncbi:hypothetical protein BJ944DRAFT_261500 [Cunninghamella echinulata]|nr:hypothetical protein BJ944DRAFT_261500 [Cunninghamella echinulata]
MVSFQCEGCGDIVKKPKCKQHQQRCHSSFTCIDCHQTFHGNSFQPHNQCITESEKYQKNYKPPTNKIKQKANDSNSGNNNGLTQQKKIESDRNQPVSIIEQLKNNKRAFEKEESAESTVQQKKTKKEKKDKVKKVKLSEWSNEDLDTDENRQLQLAIEHILKKEEKTCSIETLRNNVVSLIVSHPKASKPSSNYSTKFDQLVGLSFNFKKNKIAFSYLKA